VLAWALSAIPLICAASIAIQDDAGLRIILPAHPKRIVSLSPGATEMLFAAGAGERVIATVEYSDEPHAARLVPRIGDVVAIDMERLVALHPDIVVVWPEGGNPAQIEEIARLGIPLYRHGFRSLAELPPSLRRLGELAGTSPVAEVAARNIEARLEQLSRTYHADAPATVFLQVWDHPIYTVGSAQAMSNVLQICGTRNVFSDLHTASPAVDVEAVVARNPDVIVAAAPPGAGPEWLAGWKRFTTLRAVRTGKLISFEDPSFVRLGPSLVDAAEGLCKALAAVR
jgi:iron complex transport system substrate-binding protein